MGAAVISAADRPPSTGPTVCDEGAEYVIVLDVADFEHNELRLDVLGRELTVVGEHADDDRQPSRPCRRLVESFRVPDDADAERVDAVYTHGALEIHVRHRHDRRRTVPIERGHVGSSTPKGC